MPSEESISKSPKSVGSFSIPILRLPVGFDSMINSMFWVLEMKGERDECGSNGKLCGDCGHLLSAAGHRKVEGVTLPFKDLILIISRFPLRTSRCLHWQTNNLRPASSFSIHFGHSLNTFLVSFFCSTLCTLASNSNINYCENLCPKWLPHAKH